jgi:hypothetical protein
MDPGSSSTTYLLNKITKIHIFEVGKNIPGDAESLNEIGRRDQRGPGEQRVDFRF